MACCWLCSMQGEQLGIRMQEFIIKNIGFMDLRCISQQVSDFILLQHADAPGAEEQAVYTHIMQHVLHPRVRLAVMLRQLLELSNLLQGNILVHDGCNCTVDKTNAELYLKVIGQVMAMYRVDTQGMLFTQDDMSSGAT